MRNLAIASLAFFATLCLSVPAWAEGVGEITHLGGVLHVTRADGTSKLLSVKSEVMVGDILKTEKNTFARVKFVDGGEIVLRPGTEFKVDAYTYKADPAGKQEDNILFSLIKGGLRSVTGLLGKRSPEKFKLNTVISTIGIRGTHFGAVLCNNDCDDIPTISGQMPENGLHTDTATGATTISNAAGFIEVPAGSYSFTLDANTAPNLVPPSEGVQVTMPSAISSNKASGQGIDASDSSNTCTMD